MSTRRALAFSFLDRYAALAIAIGSSMVIARLLTPAELGVYSVTMVLVSLTMSLRDFGAGQYLVQEHELTQQRLRATWTVQLVVGLCFSVLVMATAWPLSVFYGDRRMFDIMLVVAANFLVNPFGAMTYAWLMRLLQFKSLAVMRLTAAAVGAVVAIGLAWNDWGPISLALGNLGATLANAAVAVFLRPSHFPWRPGKAEVRRVLSFGGRISFTGIFKTLGDGAPELIIGKLQNLLAAGLFSRASGLTQMFNRLLLDAVVVVAQPLFARAHREKSDLAGLFERALSYVTVLGWSFFVCLGLLAHPVVRLLYGPQWDESVPIARLLCAVACLSVTAALCPMALVASGAVDKALRLTALSTAAIATGVMLGASSGLIGAATGLLVAQALATIAWVAMTGIHLRSPQARLLASLARSAVVASGMALPAMIVVAVYGWSPPTPWTPLGLVVAIGVPTFLFLTLVTKHPIADEWMPYVRRTVFRH
jgi:O-antigen/teichoic acid export membrane protein